ncbi:MAG: glycosyltransferase family 2 protein [Cytophaga sp.]|nr:glycosyltransferase family 2 protein [Undibacterium sp.]
MSTQVDPITAVVVPNWDGEDTLGACLDSLISQSLPAEIVLVENGSTDGSLRLLAKKYPNVTVLPQSQNLGFAGGVNVGISHAIELGYDFVALFNNDAIAETDWLKKLLGGMSDNTIGITTCTFMGIDKKHLDSTGDQFTVWGLPYPRGRGESDLAKFRNQTDIFGASGGASLYRVSMLKEIGLFDEDFFAYYEDVDISFRAQLAGWKVKYVPEAIAYHDTGSTSRKIKGFTTYQTMKNQPLVIFKNVPARYLWPITWRFMIAHTLFFLRAVSRGHGWIALKGDAEGTRLLFKKGGERRRIQKSRKVSDEYVWSIMTHDLPPNAHALRKLRAKFWKLKGKAS